MIHKIWDYDFEGFTISTSAWLGITLVIGILAGISALKDEPLFNFTGISRLFYSKSSLVVLKICYLPHMALIILYEAALMVLHERAASKEIGCKKLHLIYLSHFATALIDTAVLVFVSIGFIYQ